MAEKSRTSVHGLDIEQQNVSEKTSDTCTFSEDACSTSLSGECGPTEEELATLRHIGKAIPYQAWLVAIFASLERFTFFALSAPFQNYIQNPRDDPLRPGALGLGESAATALYALLTCITSATPMFTGVVADGYWGPYKMIKVSCWVYLCGILILVLTSIPPALDAHAGVGGLIAAICLIGIGVGGVKCSVAPFTADQLPKSGKQVETLPSGEKVIIDHEITVRRVYSIFYWTTNVGAMSGLASTELEKQFGFWTAYLFAFCSLSLAVVLLMLGRSKYYIRPPQLDFREKLLGVLWCAIKGGFSLKAASPETQLQKHGKVVRWDDNFIDDFAEALKVCKVWAIYPIVWLLFTQIRTNLISQAAQMVTYGIPNDSIANLNPIFVVCVVPVLDRVVYPWMDKRKVKPRPTVRMTIGFALTAASMALSAGVQQVVYNAPPCFDMPLQCPASDNGSKPNQVSVGLQVPMYFIGAVGEVFFSVAGSEYAYNKAAVSMKSTVQAVTQFTLVLSALLGLAVSPAARDPYLVILFSSLAGAMTLATCVFAVLFWRVN